MPKFNAHRHGVLMWGEIASRRHALRHVTWDKMLVGAMTACMTLKPRSLDIWQAIRGSKV
jgi:hypothetical protein